MEFGVCSVFLCYLALCDDWKGLENAPGDWNRVMQSTGTVWTMLGLPWIVLLLPLCITIYSSLYWVVLKTNDGEASRKNRCRHPHKPVQLRPYAPLTHLTRIPMWIPRISMRSGFSPFSSAVQILEDDWLMRQYLWERLPRCEPPILLLSVCNRLLEWDGSGVALWTHYSFLGCGYLAIRRRCTVKWGPSLFCMKWVPFD